MIKRNSLSKKGRKFFHSIYLFANTPHALFMVVYRHPTSSNKHPPREH